MVNVFPSSSSTFVRKIAKVSKAKKRPIRKKIKASLIRQPIKLSKKLIWGVAKLATLIFVGRL
jgi:hypothetical protein